MRAQRAWGTPLNAVTYRPLLRLALVLLIGCSSAAAFAAEPSRRVALLVGVGSYPYLDRTAQLEGPAHDVAAMRAALTSRWGFAERDVVSLVNAEATRARILAELRALQTRSAPGDEVVVYLSGHGTSAFDSTAALPVPHGSGAFLPSDFDLAAAGGPMAGMIVGRRDLLPLLQALDTGGRLVWVISDSCYSGQQVRSFVGAPTGELPSRAIPVPVDPKHLAEQRADLALGARATAPPPYPYQRIAFLAASAETEKARDIPERARRDYPTVDEKPHGALTDALLRVLLGKEPADHNRDGLLSLVEVHRATTDFMARRSYGHSPQRLPAVAEDEHGLGDRPVLSARGVVKPVGNAALSPLRLAVGAVPPEWRQAVARVPDAQLVEATAPADLKLHPANGGVALLGPGGDRLALLQGSDVAGLQGQMTQLAWAHRLRQVAENSRRAALPLEVDPAVVGGNRVFGSLISFVVRPDRPATLLLLNIDAKGRVTVLYPTARHELAPLAANQAHHIPGAAPHQRIRVQAPEGMDIQFAIAFDEPPPGLERLFGVAEALPTDPRLAPLESWLRNQAGRLSFATSELRAFAK